MCSTQDVFKTAEVVGKVIGLKPQDVRVQYYEGSGTFGHSTYHDVAQAAALMSQAVGKPVRVQMMRADEHGYGNYGPAQLSDVRAAADAEGKLIAFEFQGWQHCWSDNETSELLATGAQAKERTGRVSMTVRPTICSMYEVGNRKLVNHQVPGLAGYLRGSYLRSPLDTGFCFAGEQIIDEVALAAGIDPIEFRRKNMRDPRWLAVLNAVAEAAKWTPRKAGDRPTGDVVTGRGVGIGGHYADAYSAAIAEIEVNRKTGQVVAKRIWGAMDAGLSINPAVVETQMIGMMTQATSRVLKEELTFSKTNVTSLDWNSYPILRFGEHPTVTPIVVQRLDQPPSGAGENLMGPTAAAIANAFFDATGVRMKQYPLTPERVTAALARKG
jgi:nicotinate dehydrogenase subunit B